MPFDPKKIKKKMDACNKSIYLHQDMIDAIEKIAKENDLSFNSVVVGMIEQCLQDLENENQQ